MKKQLMAAAAALFVTAAPAMAQDATLSVALDGTVDTQCGVFMYSGLVGLESQPDSAADDLGPRGGGGTWAANASLGIGLGTLDSGESNVLGSLAAVCNTQNAIVSVDTVNGFQLQNGSASIAYDIAISGGAGTFNSPGSYVAGGANLPNGNTRTVTMNLASFNALGQAPGSYTDSVIFTVAPQP
ncbi:MAG: hypothetical protein ABL308_13315 [Oceanicaulis sp.]